jgi:hypothetical protein
MKETTTSKPIKPLTEVDALVRIQKLLNQLSAESRKRVLAFLAGE